jgi:rubredoxin
MPNTVCWMCNARTGHERITDVRTVSNELALDFSLERINCAAYQCQVCGGMSIGLAPHQNNGSAPNTQFDQLSGDQFAWKPSPNETRTYANVPVHIAEAATEAYESHAGKHYRAAILLSRAVIEATAKENNITTGNLKAKIDELANQALIRPHIKEVAHEIRLFGNDMAHGDFVVAVAPEESELVIELMGEILNEVFQAPAKLQAVQQAVAARQAQGGQQ